MKSRFTKGIIGCVAAIALGLSYSAKAQDVHFTQFEASPLIINPANTGAFDGDFRASAVYRDQWRSALGASAFKTFAFSFDMPVIRDISIDDYLAAGIQLYSDRAGDGNLSNTSALLSVAYHKFLGSDANKAISVGFQGGYSQKNLDLSRLYFGNEFDEGNWNNGTSNEFDWLETKTDGFIINAGITYSQAISKNFAFVIGAGANNINQPLESFDSRKLSQEVGLGMRYTGQLGVIVGVSERFSIKPAALFQTQSSAMEIVGGSEFHYKLGSDYDLPSSMGVYVGGWYRHEDAIMATVGIEYKNFRIGFAYDYTTSNLKHSTNNNGGFEVAIRYIAPNPLSSAMRLLYPCSRF